MAIEVSTRLFEYSHGKRPRGYGYWLLDLTKGRTTLEQFGHTGNYSEAVKLAKAQAKKIGAWEVTVYP